MGCECDCDCDCGCDWDCASTSVLGCVWPVYERQTGIGIDLKESGTDCMLRHDDGRRTESGRVCSFGRGRMG
jgi:hypothetical protein